MREKQSVLVIDDERDVRETISDNLKEWGYDVIQAENGNRGLAILKCRNPPHIVITDIIMPDKEGLETIIEIRQRFPYIKLIAISGSGQWKKYDFLAMAKKFGADACLPKPLDMERLEQAIRHFDVTQEVESAR